MGVKIIKAVNIKITYKKVEKLRKNPLFANPVKKFLKAV